jgi:hypothetical protein
MAALLCLVLSIIFSGLACARLSEPARFAYLPFALLMLAASLLVSHFDLLR